MGTSIDLGNIWDNDKGPIVLDVKKIKQQQVIEKMNNPKNVQKTTQKILKAKNISIKEKLILITEEVMRVLGHFKPNTLVVHSREELHNYIDKCIANGIVAIDTETNNSLDPITCKLMGVCLYTPNEKNVYIPINHRDPDTKVRLDWQLTEQDIREEFQRLLDNNVYTVWHNGKFDYQVLKCTCGICMKIDWDNMIACRMIDENEKSAKLKDQYIDKIDKTQEKYDIDKLFKGVEYADVDPEVFALYSATDAYETYKLYEWQKPRLEALEGPYRLFRDIEMPLVVPVAEMELKGVMFDLDYANRLHEKYSKLLEEYDMKIDKELDTYKSVIEEWRKTPDANRKEKKVNKKGEITYSKSKSEQFVEPYNLESSTQLAIFLYDILKIEPTDKEKPRSTDKDAREEILELHKDLTILKLVDERKSINTLMDDFIIKLPKLVNSKTGAIHCHFNQLGREERGVVTGRFSSSDPNLQQIPSHNKEVRMLFTSRELHNDVECCNDCYKVKLIDEIEVDKGVWKKSYNIMVGDLLLTSEDSYDKVIKVDRDDDYVYIYTTCAL